MEAKNLRISSSPEYVATVVLRNSGLTAAEIAVKEKIDSSALTFALTKAHSNKQIRQGTARICEINHCLSVTWWPISE